MFDEVRHAGLIVVFEDRAGSHDEAKFGLVGRLAVRAYVIAQSVGQRADEDFGIASSANSTIREFGVALGVAGLTAVFLGHGGELTPTGYTGAIGPALLVGAASVSVAVVAAFFAPGRRPAG